jgi:hypothetical protein
MRKWGKEIEHLTYELPIRALEITSRGNVKEKKEEGRGEEKRKGGGHSPKKV